MMENEQKVMVLDQAHAAALLPKRVTRSNKGDYGRALVAAGTRNMAGAAVLAGEACARTGTGLVVLCSSESNRVIIQEKLPTAIFRPWGTGQMVDEKVTAIAAGPGMGTDPASWDVLRNILKDRKERTPLILDADALNLLAKALFYPVFESSVRDARAILSSGNVIITPHPGEMSRLTGLTVGEILNDPVSCAQSFAKRYGVVCLLKDERTVIASPDRLCINQTGCDGMATGGSGDVLTGMICGLAAQGVPAFEAACLGAYIHGKCGEYAQAAYGVRGMIASDLVTCLPRVLMDLEK